VCVDEVVSLSRKADLPCAGRPTGPAPLFPLRERGVAVEAAPAAFSECEDVAMPVASFEFRGAAPALLTEIIAVVSATAAVAATNDARAVPLRGRLMSILCRSGIHDHVGGTRGSPCREASVAALVRLSAAGA
jgi:hypothetical protein